MEKRPSAATVRGAQDFVPGVVAAPVADAGDRLPVAHQTLHVGAEDQPEGGIATRLGNQELQELGLGQKSDEGEAGLDPAEVGQDDGALAGDDLEATRLAVRRLQQAVGQTELIENFQGRGVNGVAAEVAVEVVVGFQQGDGDAPARQQQRQHHAGRAAAHDAAGGALNVPHVFGPGGQPFLFGHGIPVAEGVCPISCPARHRPPSIPGRAAPALGSAQAGRHRCNLHFPGHQRGAAGGRMSGSYKWT